MDELKEKMKTALDESETYGEFVDRLYNIPEFKEEIKKTECVMCILEEIVELIRSENGN